MKEGVVSLKDLVATDPSKKVEDVMKTNVFKVSEATDQKEIAHLLTTGLRPPSPTNSAISGRERFKGRLVGVSICRAQLLIQGKFAEVDSGPARNQRQQARRSV